MKPCAWGLFLLFTSLMGYTSSKPFDQGIPKHYLFIGDHINGEDLLVEHRVPNAFGSTFVLEDTFTDLRRAWRSGASKIKPKTYDVEYIESVVGEEVEEPVKFDKPLPLGSFCVYLSRVWPEMLDDYPSKEKLATFEMDKLFERDWRLIDDDDDNKSFNV